MDPTFARQFGMAVQADIQRQAMKDQQRRHPRPGAPEGRLAWRALRLVAQPWRIAARHWGVPRGDRSAGASGLSGRE